EVHKEKLRKETDSELTKLRGSVEVEVEKVKLRFSLYSQKQFELYNDLWLKLCELRRAMDGLWREATTENLWNFQEKLLSARDVLEQRAILIEPHHYNELHHILNEFGYYQMGKLNLIEMRREKERGRIFEDELIGQLIIHNGQLKTKLQTYLDQMRDCLRSQISGNY
ncbi:MAG: hypothetical protein IMZ61_12705, partial [Planctomycetes bacterium]|nr:hypothetical protein [Planctomycetota bacterium]